MGSTDEFVLTNLTREVKFKPFKQSMLNINTTLQLSHYTSYRIRHIISLWGRCLSYRIKIISLWGSVKYVISN